jgi:hypothetical protein
MKKPKATKLFPSPPPLLAHQVFYCWQEASKVRRCLNCGSHVHLDYSFAATRNLDFLRHFNHLFSRNESLESNMELRGEQVAFGL